MRQGGGSALGIGSSRDGVLIYGYFPRGRKCFAHGRTGSLGNDRTRQRVPARDAYLVRRYSVERIEPSTLRAQYAVGRAEGTAMDTSGAVLTGAAVTLPMQTRQALQLELAYNIYRPQVSRDRTQILKESQVLSKFNYAPHRRADLFQKTS